MSKVEMLRAFVNQRLTAAADEIFELFERTIAEYKEELELSFKENHRQRKLLDAVFIPEVRLHRSDVRQLLVVKEEVPSEQQERSPSPDQEDPGPLHIKEEEVDLTSQEGEPLQWQDEANIKLPFTSVPVKSEQDEDEKAQSSQFHDATTGQDADLGDVNINKLTGSLYDILKPVSPTTTPEVSGAFNQGQNLSVPPQRGESVTHQGTQKATQTGTRKRQLSSERQCTSAPVTQYHGSPLNLQFVGIVNGVPVYNFPSVFAAPLTSAASPPSTSIPKKRNRKESQQDDKPYIRKPPNAFMLFLKEQRPRFVDAMKNTGTAGVNKLIGEMWKSLSAEEQDKYFQEAHRERLLHEQQHPDWSSSNNYRKKRKRIRSKAAKEAAASESGQTI